MISDKTASDEECKNKEDPVNKAEEEKTENQQTDDDSKILGAYLCCLDLVFVFLKATLSVVSCIEKLVELNKDIFDKGLIEI